MHRGTKQNVRSLVLFRTTGEGRAQICKSHQTTLTRPVFPSTAVASEPEQCKGSQRSWTDWLFGGGPGGCVLVDACAEGIEGLAWLVGERGQKGRPGPRERDPAVVEG